LSASLDGPLKEWFATYRTSDQDGPASLEQAMSDRQADGDREAPNDYAKALGARLRAIRTQQHLSLHGVERKSGGKWKAVVVGSYERGDRAISVQRLAELADFYGVPVGELLPTEHIVFAGGAGAPPLSRIVLNIDRVAALPDGQAEILRRFLTAIQRQRGDLGGRTVAVRRDDLPILALMYDTTVEALTEKLVRWQVLAPESVILDSRP
jgi:transcriptional regulator with XRE-family HTH domain